MIDRRNHSILERTCLTTLLLSMYVLAQEPAPDPYVDLLNYQGSYQFPDGTIVTGGRMDEGGRVMLSYLDTRSVSRGGIFDASGAELTGLYGTQVSIAFAEGGDVMFWNAKDEKPIRLSRIMKPETRPAAFTNGVVQLAGTLYLPPGMSGKVPAVVLAHGSGPTTRYLGPWVTFFVAEGFAVLAFDKRGTGESGGDWQRSNYFDLAADLVKAGRWLSEQAPIDATNIGLKTSSQSGWYGPYSVKKSSVYAYLIQRAGPAVDVAVGTAHEIHSELEADGVASRDIDAAVNFWLELHEMARRGSSLESANNYLRSVREEAWFEKSFGDWNAITHLWWRQHSANMQLAPAASTADLDEPVLWFLAENDENVPYRESIEALQSVKKTKANLSVITVHDAGHSFFISDGAESMRYTDEYWANMAQWLDENVVNQSATTGR